QARVGADPEAAPALRRRGLRAARPRALPCARPAQRSRVGSVTLTSAFGSSPTRLGSASMISVRLPAILGLLLVSGCRTGGQNGDDTGPDATMPDGPLTAPCDGSRIDCAAKWEQNASDKFDGVVGNPTDLAAFAKAMPKGGDLHQHLTGAVY